jgi:hypothetical protein
MSPELEAKIKRRSRRAFRYHRKGSDKKFPRITDVTSHSLKYRVPEHPDAGPGDDGWYGKHEVNVLRVEGEIVIDIPPRDPPLDMLVKGDLDRLAKHDGIVRAYKYTDENAKSPTQTDKPLHYVVGKTLKVSHVEDDPNVDCGAGINLATLEWVARYAKSNKQRRIFAIEFDTDDLAAIPTGKDGKFRVKECYVVEELDTDKLGWSEPPVPPAPKGSPSMGPAIKHVEGDPLTLDPKERMEARKKELEKRRKAKDNPPLNIDPTPNPRPDEPKLLPAPPEKPKSHIRRIEKSARP